MIGRIRTIEKINLDVIAQNRHDESTLLPEATKELIQCDSYFVQKLLLGLELTESQHSLPTFTLSTLSSIEVLSKLEHSTPIFLKF
jgi:hypothetical protein